MYLYNLLNDVVCFNNFKVPPNMLAILFISPITILHNSLLLTDFETQYPWETPVKPKWMIRFNTYIYIYGNYVFHVFKISIFSMLKQNITSKQFQILSDLVVWGFTSATELPSLIGDAGGVSSKSTTFSFTFCFFFGLGAPSPLESLQEMHNHKLISCSAKHTTHFNNTAILRTVHKTHIFICTGPFGAVMSCWCTGVPHKDHNFSCIHVFDFCHAGPHGQLQHTFHLSLY